MRTPDPTRRWFGRLLGAAVSMTGLLTNTAGAADPGFGRSPTSAEIASVDIDVKPDGSARLTRK